MDRSIAVGVSMLPLPSFLALPLLSLPSFLALPLLSLRPNFVAAFCNLSFLCHIKLFLARDPQNDPSLDSKH